MTRRYPPKRRKVTTAYACVGGNGKPFVTMSSPEAQTVGRFEIFENYRDALRNSIGPGYVRQVRIYVDAEPYVSAS